MTKRLYGAYGSNLNMEQMEMRCPGAVPIGVGYLNDYELIYKGSKTGAYLTVEKRKGSKVPLGIWEVTAEDEKKLDIYEGYPNLYYKKEFEITVDRITKGKIRAKVFIYIMDESRQLALPSSSYVETCLIGYGDFDLNPKYLRIALMETMKRMTK